MDRDQEDVSPRDTAVAVSLELVVSTWAYVRGSSPIHATNRTHARMRGRECSISARQMFAYTFFDFILFYHPQNLGKTFFVFICRRFLLLLLSFLQLFYYGSCDVNEFN